MMLLMDKLIDWLKAERGRIPALARHLAVKPPSVHAWLDQGRVPVLRAVAIEKFTGGEITRKDMFPDSWSQIWPELAVPSTESQEA